MKRNASYRTVSLAALLVGLGLAGSAVAQETQARARTATQSLNQGASDSTLGTKPTASPPLVSRPAVSARPAASGRTLTDVLNQTVTDEPSTSSAETARAPVAATAAAPITAVEIETAIADLPVGPPSALPPLPVGYYSRGTLNCNAVWAREGDLAWLSQTAFTIDFGGCEAGTIEPVSDTVWREDQRCVTELGGDGGTFSVEYEVMSPTTLATRSRLGAETTGQDDIWTHCDATQVQDEARFHPDDATRPG